MGAPSSMQKKNIGQVKLFWDSWKYGVPKSTITYFLKVIFPPLKKSSLKHLWGIMGVGKIIKRIVIEVIDKIVATKKRGKQNLPSQGRRSIHCGNIRNRWGTWTPKRYADLHWWDTTSAPWTIIITKVCPHINSKCNADWWLVLGEKRKSQKRKQQRRHSSERFIFNRNDVKLFRNAKTPWTVYLRLPPNNRCSSISLTYLQQSSRTLFHTSEVSLENFLIREGKQ